MTEFELERRRQYKANRNLGMTRENAAIAAGYGRSIALARATPPSVVDYQALFEQKGMTNQKRVDACIEGMNAIKMLVDKDGGEHSTPDWTARHKYLETMLKLTKQLDTGKQGDTNVLIVGTLAERIKKAREKNLPGLHIKSAEVVEDGTIVVDADVVEVEENGEKDGE